MKTVLHFIALTMCFLFSLNLVAQPFNDSCHTAHVFFNLDNRCQSFTFSDATFDGISGTCTTSDFANTWFEFIAVSADLEITVDAAASAYITLFDVNQVEPCNDTLWNQELCSIDILALGNRLIVGRRYKFSVAFQGPFPNNYSVCINNPIPSGIPPNDKPCGARLFSADGTCRTGYNHDATMDFFNPDCIQNTEASVWYKTFLTPGNSRLEVTLSSTFSGGYSMYLSRFNNNNCNSFPIIVGDTLYCDNLPNPDTIVFENLTSNTVYYLQIASRASGTGTFSFCMQELADPSGCGINDDCLDATDISVPASEPDTICFTGCNRSADPGPQDVPGSCYYMEHATVWHVITPDVSAAAMRIILSSTELTNPQIALYTGDTCTDLSPVLCDFSTNGFLDVALFDMIPGNKYWLAVSDLFGAEGEYQVCIDQLALDVGCNIISSLRPVDASYGSPVSGPYQSGESVTFCYQVTAWQKGLCNWLQGIVPRFGSAWDPASFRSSGRPVTITKELEKHVPGAWRWYSQGTVSYNVSNPAKGYVPGSPLPGGWYFTNDDFSHTNPNFSRGDGDNCTLESGVSWEICFALKVKDYADCLTLDGDDASVRIETFADSEIGIYPAVSCLDDQPKLFVGDLICCEGTSISDAQFNSCNGAVFNYNLNPTNDPNLTFSWDPIIPDGVFGPTSGTGNNINDIIFNFSTTTKTVFYVVSILDSAGCFGAPATVSVTVQPALNVEAGMDQEVCQGRSIRLGGNPTASGGSGNYNYNWSNGSNNQANPFYIPDGNELIVLSVSDSRGCRGADSVLITVTPAPRTTISAALCAGDTFEFNGQKITVAGMYNDFIPNGAANGCDSFITANIIVYDEIIIDNQTIMPNTGSDNGSISITVGGGTAPYNVSWTHGATGTVLTGLKNGLYTAIIRDANNCVRGFNFIVPLMSGNRDIELENLVSIQPNPIIQNQSFHINNTSNRPIQSISIFTANGQLVEQLETSNGLGLIPITKSAIIPGLHVVRIELDDTVIYKKLLVQ